jgi:hypothetical protein
MPTDRRAAEEQLVRVVRTYDTYELSAPATERFNRELERRTRVARRSPTNARCYDQPLVCC